jgi:two-component system, NtrC family, nitrogen regulation sensor histidine kinase GlnL
MTSAQLHMQIIEALPEPIFVFDAGKLALTWMNPAAESWLQCSLSSKLGAKVSQIVNGFERLENIARATAENDTTTRGHDLHIHVRGVDIVYASYLVFPVRDGVAVMLSAQRSSVGNNVDEHNDQAVGMVGHMLAHELKNPLAGIYGAVQLLESSVSDPSDIEITDLIKSEVKRIGRLVDKMEDFSAVDMSGYENFNIHSVLRKALLLFQNAENTSIEFVENYDPSLPDVYGNIDKLMQVMINFLANATDAVKTKDSNGKIEIQTVYRAGVRKRALDGRVHALPVEVRVIDNGAGVPTHIKERIFQPFVTGKANGHGLGLALVSKIIDEHGGITTCNAEPGRTVFSILLPKGK